MTDPLIKRIHEYLTIPGIGQAISLASDIPLRKRLAKSSNSNIQDKIADDNLEYLNKDKKYHDINEPLYKAIELGELLICLEQHGACPYAKECWVTRKGFCELKRRQKKGNISPF